jgi:hypothetical protein
LATLRHRRGHRANAENAFQGEVNMTHPMATLWPYTDAHSTRTEGIRLGLIIGTITWLWVAFVDVIAGQPWQTFSLLGGILVFTVMHYLLNVTYGLVLVSVVHTAERAPSVMMGLVFGGLTLQGAFAMITNLVVESVGNAAWLAITGGSIISTAVAITLLSRTHPLKEYLRRAEEET